MRRRRQPPAPDREARHIYRWSSASAVVSRPSATAAIAFKKGPRHGQNLCRGQGENLLLGDRLHLLLRVRNDRVEIVIGVIGALQHLQPRTLRRVDLLEEG